MKKTLIVICTLILASCSSDNSAVQTVSIVGNWTYIVPATQCIESYKFNSDNTVRITALDEVIDGTYSISSLSNINGRPLLSILLLTDNQQPDCEGNNDDDSNSVLDVFIEFPIATAMSWYTQSVGGIEILTLSKN